MAGKSPHAAVCAHSIAFAHNSSAATLSTSLDGKVACHKVWGAVLDISGTSPCIVLPAVVLTLKISCMLLVPRAIAPGCLGEISAPFMKK
eukprot:5482969-Ditylum_brightwellii.AAC.1